MHIQSCIYMETYHFRSLSLFSESEKCTSPCKPWQSTAERGEYKQEEYKQGIAQGDWIARLLNFNYILCNQAVYCGSLNAVIWKITIKKTNKNKTRKKPAFKHQFEGTKCPNSVYVKPGTHPEHSGTPRNTPRTPRNTNGTPPEHKI